MNDKLKIMIGLILIYLAMPVIFGVIVAKAFADHNSTLVLIIFFTLLILEIISVVIKVVRYNKSKKQK